MTKAQIEVITSVQPRRRWSQAETGRIVATAMEPGWRQATPSCARALMA
jgi:hypothetical protein